MSNAALLEELSTLPGERRAERVRAAGDPDTLLVALGDEAEQLAGVEVSRALRASELVVELADTVGGARSQARARRARGQVLAYAGRFAEALDICHEAVRIGQAGDEPIEAARARLASMHALSELARYDEAIAAGLDAYDTFHAAGQSELGARADINLGAAYQNQDNPKLALEHLDRARRALEGTSTILLFFVENNSGEALLLLNRFAQAEAAFSRARLIAIDADAAFLTALAEGNLADLAARRGMPHRALYHFERARRCFENDEANSHHARLIAEQAEVLEGLGMFAEALHVYEDAVPRLEQHGLAPEEARAATGAGRCCLRLERFEKAHEHLAAAAAIYARIDQGRSRARVDLIRAELDLRQGRITDAVQLIDAARVTLQDRPLDAAIVAVHAARMALERHEYTDAAREVDAALHSIEPFDLAPLRADLLHLRGRMLRAQRRPAEAVESLTAAVHAIERVRGTLQAERFRSAFLGDRLAVYEDAVAAVLDTSDAERTARAFGFVEQAKGRALLDLASGALEADPAEDANDDDGPESDLATHAAVLRSELNVLYNRLAEQLHTGTDTQAATRWRDEIEPRERELAGLEDRLASTRGGSGLFAPTSPLTRVQDSLAPSDALLEFFFARGEVLAFVIRRDREQAVRKLALADDLADDVRKVQFQLTRAARPGALSGKRAAGLLADAQRALGRLWTVLIEPLRDALHGAERLIVVPHGCLHFVPFHALWDGERYLVETFEITSVPSAGLLDQLSRREKQQAGPHRAAVIGYADEAAPQIEAEALAVAELLKAPQAHIGEQASVAALRGAAGESDVIHLACHGRFTPTRPLESGLRLADRWLTLREIYALRLRATLVTLSGCETGRADVAGGDELVGLLRGFLGAGAESLLVSLWALHDRAATEQMRDFYRLWLDHPETTKSAALRQAQLNAIEKSPHPLYWAPLELVGRPT